MDAAPLLPWYLHSGGEAGGWCWWLSVAQGWWCWVEGHLQTHEEPSEAPHRALHSQTGPDSPALLILWSQLPGPPCPSPSSKHTRDAEMQRCSHDSAHPSPSSAAEQSWAHTVGTGIELQAERASTALQGTLLPARAAIGPAGLCTTPAAASGCVVRAGETIKLQQAVKG